MNSYKASVIIQNGCEEYCYLKPKHEHLSVAPINFNKLNQSIEKLVDVEIVVRDNQPHKMKEVLLYFHPNKYTLAKIPKKIVVMLFRRDFNITFINRTILDYIFGPQWAINK
jgi:hypothetical protein